MTLLKGNECEAGGAHIVIITSASHNIGMGHAMRQMTLAQTAVSDGHVVSFVTDADVLVDLCAEIKIPCHLLSNLNELDRLVSVIEQLKPSHIVIDVHEGDFPKFRILTKRWHTVLVVSPVGYDFKGYGPDMVVIGEQLTWWNEKDVVRNEHDVTSVHFGRAYMFFRDEFSNGPGSSAEERRHSVLICHGGADPYGLTGRCLNALEYTKGVYWVDILVGVAFRDADNIRAIANRSKHKCNVVEGAYTIAERMRDAAIALINGGNTRYELCLTATPFIALSIRQRQLECTEQITSLGAGVNLGLVDNVSDEEIADAVDGLIGDPTRRSRMQDAMTGLFDMSGAQRVLSIILQRQ